MLKLSPEILKELLNILVPFMEDERSRRPFLVLALGNDAPLLQHINWSGSVTTFTGDMLLQLVNIGRKEAFYAVLEYAKSQVGTEGKERIDKLLPSINSLFLEKTPSNSIISLLHSSTTYNEDLEEADKILFNIPFIGRTKELEQLNQLIVNNQCRLVTLVGMAGMGKSCLAAQFTHNVKDKFRYVIWKNLRIYASFEDFLNKLLNFLSVNAKLSDNSINSSDRIQTIINYLKDNYCLLILDDLTEIIDKIDKSETKYKVAWENFGNFLEQATLQPHNSTILITCHRHPSNLNEEKIKSKNQFIEIKGLKSEEIKQIFQNNKLDKIISTVGENQWERLVKYFGGNPVILKIVAEKILYNNIEINDFIETLSDNNTLDLEKRIENILDRQFNSLGIDEQKLMYWLAFRNEPAAKGEFKSLLGSNYDNSINSLESMSLIIHSPSGYTQVPMIMDYVTRKIVDVVNQEISENQPSLIDDYPLLDSQAKDYIKEIQKRRILTPVINKLREDSKNISQIKDQLVSMLKKWRDKQPIKGYLGGNIINLVLEFNLENNRNLNLKIDLKEFNFFQIPLGKADLQGQELNGIDFRNSDLSQASFSENLGCIHSVVFSADGKYFATAEANGDVRLWETDTYKQVKLFRDEDSRSQIWSIAFAPDGKMIASAGEDKIVRLWDVEKGTKINDINVNQCIYSVIFRHDGKYLIAGGDKDITIYNLKNNDLTKIPVYENNESKSITSIAINGRNILAIGCQDGLVRLLKIKNVDSSEILHTFKEHDPSKTVRSIAFSHDGNIVASGSEDGTIKLWRIDEDKSFETLREHKIKRVWTLSFSKDSKILAIGSTDENPNGIDEHHNIHLCNLHDYKLTKLGAHQNQLRAIAFCPKATQSNLLISGGDDHTIKMWDTTSNWKLQKTIQGYTNRIWSTAFSPCGKRLVSGCEDNRIRVWNVQTKQCIQTLQKHTDWVWSAVFSPDGKKIASASEDNTIYLWNWNLKDDKWVCDADNPLTKHTDRVRVVAFSPDSKKLVSGGNDHQVIVWDLTKPKPTPKILGESCKKHTRRILSLVFSPNGHWVASSSRDKTIRLWNLETDQVQTLGEHDNQVHSIAFNPDGDTLISGGFDNKVNLWDIKKQVCIHTFEEHTDRILCVAFHPDGLIFASSGHDKKIRLWSKTNKESIRVLEGHKGSVESINFSPKGGMLVSSSQDQTIKIWDIFTGKCLGTLEPDSKPYKGMIISGATGLSKAQKDTLITLGAVDE
ncbi:NB-ARC domain-containing protein [Nostoc sp.]|uniref:WD40 domain-containing protein n=1 Tax=Nostoc sp. TaxID=1180 RepID=UPI002FF500CB